MKTVAFLLNSRLKFLMKIQWLEKKITDFIWWFRV